MSQDSPAARLRLALDLYEVGEAMVRQRVRRDHPGIDEAGVNARVRAWLRHRPGAEFGDHPGPRSSRIVRALSRP